MSMGLSIVTPTYARDLSLFARQHASVEEFLAPDCEHVVIVPKVDRPAFAPYAGPRTRIIPVEDVVPGHVFLLPRALKVLRSGRDIWLTLRTAPVRGWIMQQIVKLAAANIVDRDVLLILDSDLAFTRPVGLGDFVRDGKIRLYKQSGTTGHLPSHQRWYRSSAHLLGIDENLFYGDNYIAPAISWSRPVLIRLLRHLEAQGGRSWWLTLARTMHLSEYTLYGAYADAVLGAEAGHYHDSDDHFLNSWDYDLLAPGGEDAFLRAVRPDQWGVHVDSQLRLGISDRNQLLDRVCARAAEVRAGAEQTVMQPRPGAAP
jgi:hypothetical protein